MNPENINNQNIKFTSAPYGQEPIHIELETAAAQTDTTAEGGPATYPSAEPHESTTLGEDVGDWVTETAVPDTKEFIEDAPEMAVNAAPEVVAVLGISGLVLAARKGRRAVRNAKTRTRTARSPRYEAKLMRGGRGDAARGHQARMRYGDATGAVARNPTEPLVVAGEDHARVGNNLRESRRGSGGTAPKRGLSPRRRYGIRQSNKARKRVADRFEQPKPQQGGERSNFYN